MNYELSTENLMNILKSVKSEKEFEKYLQEYTREGNGFGIYFLNYICEHDLDTALVIKNSGLDRNYAYQMLGGKKNPAKYKIVCMCIAAGMNIVEINRCIKLGGHAELYPKNTVDAIIIKNINNENYSVIDIDMELDKYGLPVLEKIK